MGWIQRFVSRNKRLINNQKHNKMKKVDKSSFAGTNDESSTNVHSSQVCQPIAKHDVSSRFKWKSISYCGEEPYTDTPPWVEIKNTSEDVNGNKIVTVWNKNKTPKIQSFYNGVLVHSCNRDAKEFGRDFFNSYGWHQEMIHREAESIVENGC